MVMFGTMTQCDLLESLNLLGLESLKCETRTIVEILISLKDRLKFELEVQSLIISQLTQLKLERLEHGLQIKRLLEIQLELAEARARYQRISKDYSTLLRLIDDYLTYIISIIYVLFLYLKTKIVNNIPTNFVKERKKYRRFIIAIGHRSQGDGDDLSKYSTVMSQVFSSQLRKLNKPQYLHYSLPINPYTDFGDNRNEVPQYPSTIRQRKPRILTTQRVS